jgi:hypothetical protein
MGSTIDHWRSRCKDRISGTSPYTYIHSLPAVTSTRPNMIPTSFSSEPTAEVCLVPGGLVAWKPQFLSFPWSKKGRLIIFLTLLPIGLFDKNLYTHTSTYPPHSLLSWRWRQRSPSKLRKFFAYPYDAISKEQHHHRQWSDINTKISNAWHCVFVCTHRHRRKTRQGIEQYETVTLGWFSAFLLFSLHQLVSFIQLIF